MLNPELVCRPGAAQVDIDAGSVAAHLAGAIQHPTVSARDGTNDATVFADSTTIWRARIRESTGS